MAKKKKEAASAAGSGQKVTVRVNDKVAEAGGAYHDPDREANPKPIGEKPMDVIRTPFVNQRIAAGDLVEVRGEKSEEK